MKSDRSNILRWGRIVLAIIVTAVLTAVLVSHAMTIPRMAGFLTRIQFIPAALAFSVSTIVVILLCTLFFGRIYCSVLCPLGVLMDLIARLPRLGKFARRRVYHFCEPLTKVRNLTLIVVVISIFLGISAVLTALDPYSIYSRFCVYCVKPVWYALCNLFSSEPIRFAAASVTGISVSLGFIGVIGWIALKRGRLYCNTICPVGTTLGYISRYSIFRIDINTDKCIECRKCEHVCKSQCIDLSTHVIDMSRCVTCFDCLPVCPNDAIHFTSSRHQLSYPLMMRSRSPLAGSAAGFDGGGVNMSRTDDDVPGDKLILDRRAFLTAGLLIASGSIIAQGKKVTKLVGGLGTDQMPSDPTVPVTPPGVTDYKDFLNKCTGCGLCISHCPTGVLRASTTQYGVLRAFHPVKNYDEARCAIGCTRCTHLCPTGALKPLTKIEKRETSVGLASVSLSRCISYSHDSHCGKCAEACEPKAIKMIDKNIPGRGLAPVVDASACIGCGACQFVCPATPQKAIVVNGFS